MRVNAVTRAALSLLAAPTLALSMVAAMPAAHATEITHVCGGVGEDELKALEKRAPEFNIGFWMVKGPRGEFLADVPVRITQNGKTVAEFTAGGPLCWVKAPPGTYQIHATHDGVQRTVTVKPGDKNVYLRW